MQESTKEFLETVAPAFLAVFGSIVAGVLITSCGW